MKKEVELVNKITGGSNKANLYSFDSLLLNE